MVTNKLKNKIEFITASAGTGKTFRLVEVVSQAVISGEATPASVIATTFTAAAASELQERLARCFHAEGMHDEALGLREGYIGTVHGICLDLLTRFAFEAGLAPEMRILDETEGALLLNRAINESGDDDSLLELLRLSDRLEQKDFQTGKYHWEKALHSIVGEARGNDIAFDRLPEMGEASWKEMADLLPPVTGDDLDALLSKAVGSALADMPEQPATKGSQNYRRDLLELQRNLDEGRMKWSDWADFSTKKPTKAELDATEHVRLVASRHEEHAGFQQDLQTYLETLFKLAAQVGNRFQELKRERGAVDFQDLEKETLDLLQTSQQVRDILTEEIDLLVVDEFQDTSPIQLALFARLGECAKRVVWVGDIKQSIYGFRGADPELICGAVQSANKQEPLATSWRSLPDVVDFNNAIFAGAFKERLDLPEDETVVSAHRQAPDGAAASLEIASISSGVMQKNGKAKALTAAQKPGVLADLVEDVLRRADPVVDKGSVSLENPQGALRPFQARDVAVLVRSHKRAMALSGALRERGIDVVIAGQGLLATPECRLAMACLRRLLDAKDSLATAEIVALENQHQTQEWIEQRIQFVQARVKEQGKWPDLTSWATGGGEGDQDDGGGLLSAAVLRLETVRQGQSTTLLSPLQRFDLACATADVSRIAASWGPSPEHAHQRAANLEQLRKFIIEYEERCASFGLPATIMGLFAALSELASNSEDKRAVDGGIDAVMIRTYHGAKGLEWPVVITADLDSKIRSRIFQLRNINTLPDQALDLNHPLANRELRLWINPYGRRKTELIERMEESEVGRAAAQSAEQEELRLLYVGMTRARDRLILPCEANREHPWLQQVGEAATSITEVSGDTQLCLADASFTIHRSQFAAREEIPQPDPVAAVSYPIRVVSQTERLPAKLVPSSAQPLPQAKVGEVLEFGERLPLSGKFDERDLGDAMHRIFAAEILNPDLEADSREQRTAGILAAFGLSGTVRVADVLQTVDVYRAVVREKFQPLSEQVEVPFTYHNKVGQQISGYIDHLLETADGPVILDHKIFPGRREAWEAKALSYSGQLAVYAEVLQSEKPVRTVIHLVTAGVLVEVV